MENDDTLKFIESSLVTIASSVPILSSVATGWSEYKDYVHKKHIQNILEKYSSRIRLLEDQVDKIYISSNEFKSLLIKTCFYGKEEFSEKKRDYLSNFLANSTLNINSRFENKSAILESLIRLSEIDVIILNKFDLNEKDGRTPFFKGIAEYNNKVGKAYFSEEILIGSFTNINQTDVISTLNFLKSMNLIMDSSETIGPFNINHHISKFLQSSEIYKKNDELAYNPHENFNNSPHYTISFLGYQVLQYIK